MRVRRGHGQAQIRVSGSLPEGTRRAPAFPHLRQHQRLEQLGSRYAPITNWLAGSALGKSLASTFLGISPQRQQPAFASQSLPDWFASRGQNGHAEAKYGTVALYNDTFMNYNYPEIGIAAIEVLEAAGYRVELVNGGCCGRPMISKGLLDQARDQARSNIDALYAYASQGVPIVGCEPSCLLTLRDEYPEFVGDDRAKTVAERSFLIDEFLASAQAEGRLDLQFSDLEKQVMFHGHCHQKAHGGYGQFDVRLGNAARLSGRADQPPAAAGWPAPSDLRREHYDISMQIGGLSLFPAIAAKPDAEVAVMGVSCRQQVEHGAGRRARHLIEVLRDAVVLSE